ncbi:MFS transporter [Macrococcus psychrotolerans]|uniref:MFS transporter n=1 Tax=Macrococcus psychrotolerans TaxID=3039389 RepID=A0AAT9P8T8_9STAP|nr:MULTISPECIES: MFS transporter [Macrococcus]QYA33837.1 MFS transporter [Macrococcus sp. 19Msa1099]QYA38657.1 MFS transporter [Macrococcus caseolyticus]QYA77364.1 MFS transporter [Macrococcus caseolyticus]
MYTKRFRGLKLLLLVAVLLLSANLRAPLTSVGVLLPAINDDLQLSAFATSIIAILPLLAFSFASLFAAPVSTKIGLNRTIVYALIVITVGIILRSLGSSTLLFTGILLIGIGIAFGNVLAPVFIKASFPLQVGLVTALYTVSMNIFGALSSAVSAPIAKATNYNISLAMIGIVTIITLIFWIIVLQKDKEVEAPQPVAVTSSIWRSPLAWQITLFMGGQSVIFYSLINFLPIILKEQHIPVEVTGGYLTVLQIAIIIFTFIIPMIAANMAHQVYLGCINGLLFIAGIAGMIYGDVKYMLVYILFIGVALGISFGLVNLFFSLKTEYTHTAKQLSGMAQAIGYLFAALSVLIFGVIHDYTHNWNHSLYFLLADALLMLIVGMLAGRKHTIEGHTIK